MKLGKPEINSITIRTELDIMGSAMMRKQIEGITTK